MIDYSTMDDKETFVPHHMRGAYQRYIEHGIDAGSFGMAIINLDTEGAVIRADSINMFHIETQMAWVKKYIKGEK